MTVTRAAQRLALVAGVILFGLSFVAGAWQMLAIWGRPRVGLDHLGLASRALQKGDVRSAIAEYEAAVRMVPEDSYSASRLENLRAIVARVNAGTPATPDALAEVEQAIRRTPADPKLHLRRGELLY